MDHTVFVTCNYINACLYLVSVYQMAHPQTVFARQLNAAYYSFIYPVTIKG